ncbi:MAG TPA: M1 family aminopeptidase [Polyangiales bacterium]|nr:M1 family aminopeptidase [Polyangiales bacterium]
MLGSNLESRLSLLIGFWLAAACASQPTAPAATPSAPPQLEVKSDRLPGDVKPLSYTLELTVVPKSDRFSGKAQILVQVTTATPLVLLHAKGLNVTAVHAVAGQNRLQGSYQQLNGDGVSALRFPQALPPGQLVLEITYDAPFDRQLRGLYRVDQGGESYAFTQFEPISARSAFPSFDEPSWKTPYELWLTVPKDAVAVSNTLVIGEEPSGDDKKRVHFAKTKPLPSYLVAFAVGPLEIVDGPPVPPSPMRPEAIPVRGIAAKGKSGLLTTALAEIAPQITALERYFGIAYPFGKLDVVAVPDFGGGAMENAGLVTFREQLLLLDPKSSSEQQRRGSTYVMAHEFAHQWFGNLVTMYYWDDIWLNEAFATWMGNRIVAELHPQQKAELSQLLGVDDAMSSDAQVSARMIRQPIVTSHDIVSAFDGITYQKGGAVLGMFERYVTSEVFRSGVQRYLSGHAEANASTDDLLEAINASAGKDVKTSFNTFLTQAGVPLVEAELACASGTAELRLRQSRYLPLGSTGSKEQRWQIPVCARYELQGQLKETCMLLSEPSGVIGFEKGLCPAWVMPNADGAGYYRFSLGPADLEKLRTRGYKRLNARERFSLATSLIAAFDSGAVTAKDLLGILPVFAADSERIVVTVASGFLSYLQQHLATDAETPKLAAFANKLFLPLRAKLGFREQSGESAEAKLLRGTVLETLADVGREAATRTKLEKWGRDYLGGASFTIKPDAVPKDLADSAVSIALESGDEALWDGVYQLLSRTEDAVIRARLIRALGSVRDARSVKALGLTLDPALRVNEVLIPLRAQFEDRRTRAAALDYLEQNFDKIAARLPPSAAANTVWFAASSCDAATVARAEAFFTPRIQPLPGGPRSLAGALERLKLCAATADAQRASFQQFFAK